MRIALTLFAFIVSTPALALDFSDASLLYNDAPFNAATAAGISVLTNLDATEGNPDGTFAPDRSLNRAEFLKIALSSVPNLRVSTSDASNCFPDVHREDWFSKYVCLAKKRGVVGGYPDGNFKPANHITYAEALKILGELYGYTAWAAEDAPWYQIYVQAAQNHKTILPINLPYDFAITRGHMARLAAAYRAESEGQLEQYRALEQRRVIATTPPPPPPSTVHSPVQTNAPTLPTESRFLVLGTLTDAIADAAFYPLNGAVSPRLVEVLLEDPVASISRLLVVDTSGTQRAVLTKQDNVWTGTFPKNPSFTLPDRTGTTLALVADMKASTAGGRSGEDVLVQKFVLNVERIDGKEMVLLPSGAHYQLHTTAQGRISHISKDTSVVPNSGDEQLIASYTFSGEGSVRLEEIVFAVDVEDVQVSNWIIQSNGTPLGCTPDDGNNVFCSLVGSVGDISDTTKTFELRGDVALGGTGSVLDVTINTWDTHGVTWTDGAQTFMWIEASAK